MKYLMDTCTLIWYLTEKEKLSKTTYNTIHEGNDKIGVSIVSLWEIVIKSAIGKLPLPSSLKRIEEILDREGIERQPIILPVLEALQSLPLHHNDPFDRTIISTAISGGWSILTPDPLFDHYDVQRIW